MVQTKTKLLAFDFLVGSSLSAITIIDFKMKPITENEAKSFEVETPLSCIIV